MALPDYVKREFGTSVIWGEAGATGIGLTVTNTLTFEALAAGSGRMGAEVDLGAQWDEDQFVQLIIESGTAPTAGGTVELYMACSLDGTNYPGGASGSDAAWPADGNEDEWRKQLGAPVVVLVATNDANTVMQQQPVIWRPSGRYVVPIVDNNMDQAVRDETTATDNDSRVVMTPRRLLIQDAA
jgi:hypothetical protein